MLRSPAFYPDGKGKPYGTLNCENNKTHHWATICHPKSLHSLFIWQRLITYFPLDSTAIGREAWWGINRKGPRSHKARKIRKHTQEVISKGNAYCKVNKNGRVWLRLTEAVKRGVQGCFPSPWSEKSPLWGSDIWDKTNLGKGCSRHPGCLLAKALNLNYKWVV